MTAVWQVARNGGHQVEDRNHPYWYCRECGMKRYGSNRLAFYFTPCKHENSGDCDVEHKLMTGQKHGRSGSAKMGATPITERH